MRCFVCQRGMAEGVSLFRINERGVKGIWTCEVHRPAASPHIDPQVREIVHIIEDDRD